MSPNMLEEEGIIPRSIGSIFNEISEGVALYWSFMQIYNEEVYDLLRNNAFENPIDIREDDENSNHMEGLSEYVVTKKDDCIELLLRGEKNR